MTLDQHEEDVIVDHEVLTSVDVKNVIDSFQLSSFRPFFIPEANIQTIISNFFPTPSKPPSTRLRLRSSDDEADFFVDVCEPLVTLPSTPTTSPSSSSSILSTDSSDNYYNNTPIAIIVPGMESNSAANITLRMINCLRREGFRVYTINYRSCCENEQLPSTLKLYNAGFTDDVLTLLEYIKTTSISMSPSVSSSDSSPSTPSISIFGFSLGANIVINLLGRHANLLHSYGVIAAGAVAVPFNPTKCVQVLDKGWKGALYSARLVSDLKNKIKSIVNNNPDNEKCQGVIDLKQVEAADRVGKIDEAVIAPVFGYKDRYDYYDDIDSTKWISKVQIPTLILNAKDDPFYYHHQLNASQLVQSTNNVKVVWSKSGGHCAFLDDYTVSKDQDGGYFQREMTRWFQHVIQMRKQKFLI